MVFSLTSFRDGRKDRTRKLEVREKNVPIEIPGSPLRGAPE
jgi:hypothetical protein